MKLLKNPILIILMMFIVGIFLNGCKTPASEKIIGKWSGATEKNKTVAKENAKSSFEQEMLFEMYSAMRMEFTKNSLKTAIGDMEYTGNYEVISESENGITIKTEDGIEFVISFNGDNEIIFEDEKGKMHMVKLL